MIFFVYPNFPITTAQSTLHYRTIDHNDRMIYPSRLFSHKIKLYKYTIMQSELIQFFHFSNSSCIFQSKTVRFQNKESHLDISIYNKSSNFLFSMEPFSSIMMNKLVPQFVQHHPSQMDRMNCSNRRHPQRETLIIFMVNLLLQSTCSFCLKNIQHLNHFI